MSTPTDEPDIFAAQEAAGGKLAYHATTPDSTSNQKKSWLPRHWPGATPPQATRLVASATAYRQVDCQRVSGGGGTGSRRAERKVTPSG